MTLQIERDQYGRPLLPDPVSKKRRPWTRTTTMSSTIQDRRALEAWAQRNTVRGFVINEDLLVRAAAAGEDRAALDEIVEAAQSAARASAKADLGTALHAITEKLDRGESVIVPRDYRDDVEAYQNAMTQGAIKVLPQFIETMTVNVDLETAGTPDRLVMCPRSDKPVVYDLKTGANAIRYSLVEISAQLAIYAGASHYYDGALHDMPQVEQRFGIVCHLPVGSGQATLYSIDLTIGRQIARLCHQVRQWRRAEGIAKPFNVPFSDAEVRRRIELIKDALGDSPLPMPWPEGVPTPSRLSRPYDNYEAAAVGTWCVFVEEQLDLVPF